MGKSWDHQDPVTGVSYRNGSLGSWAGRVGTVELRNWGYFFLEMEIYKEIDKDMFYVYYNIILY